MYQYCEGWEDKSNMGISVLCVFDYATQQNRVFCDDNIKEFKELLDNSAVVVGFNHKQFDNQVIKACWNIDLNYRRQYDLMEEIVRIAEELPAGDFPMKDYHSGYGLNHSLKANFADNGQKKGNGKHAPIYYQRQEWGKLVDYCLEDVRLTKKLFEQIIRNKGIIRNPKNPRKNIRLDVSDLISNYDRYLKHLL